MERKERMKERTKERLTAFLKTTALVASAAAAAALVLTLLQYVDKRNAQGAERTEGASISITLTGAGIGHMSKEAGGYPSAGAGRLSLTLMGDKGEEGSGAIPQRVIPQRGTTMGTAILTTVTGDKESMAISRRNTAVLATENDIPKAASPLLKERSVSGEDSCELDCSRESEDELWEFFKAMGCTDAGAAGAMGNLYAESRLIPSAKTENFSRTKKTGGGGLAGWMCRGRFADLYKLAEKRGKSWEDMSLQKEFLKQELDGTYQHVKDVITSADDPEYAADYFCVYYEGCIICKASEGSFALESGTKDGISMITGKKYQGLSFRREMARVFYERHAAQ